MPDGGLLQGLCVTRGFCHHKTWGIQPWAKTMSLFLFASHQVCIIYIISSIKWAKKITVKWNLRRSKIISVQRQTRWGTEHWWEVRQGFLSGCCEPAPQLHLLTLQLRKLSTEHLGGLMWINPEFIWHINVLPLALIIVAIYCSHLRCQQLGKWGRVSRTFQFCFAMFSGSLTILKCKAFF